MAHGLRVRGNTSIALIDETYQNFSLRHHGSLYLGNQQSGNVLTRWWNDLALPVDTPAVAFRSNYPALIESVTRSGGVATYRFWSIQGPATVEYFLFDRPDYAAPVGSNYGLRVRNGSGNVTYDSRMRYLKVIDGRSASYNFDQFGESQSDVINFETTYSGVRVAVMQVLRPWTHQSQVTNPGPNPDVLEYLTSGMVSNANDSHVKVVRDIYSGASHSGSTQIDPDINNAFCYNYQVIDVTGY